MAKKQKTFKPKARVPRGFRDMAGDELYLQRRMIATISDVYQSHGFDALDTSAFEYADALGKFLPDEDRPNAGVFALEDDDKQWLSLRYDLTAPLARYVAEHYDALPKPFRRYQWGPVWRNEKPGPGRYRQFLQIDADTVGAANMGADAEICMMAADCMAALGIAQGDYVVRINNRKIMDGLLQRIGLEAEQPDYETRRLAILRAMDKYDRLGLAGVRDLLGSGRRDESGDFTPGADLEDTQIDAVAGLVSAVGDTRPDMLDALEKQVGETPAGAEGIAELRKMDALFTRLGYGVDRLCIDPAVVRGLGYYTGPVYEIDLTFDARDADGTLTRFGSVGGGGRYDDLIKRFKGVEIPATGISIGVSRLAAALTLLDKADAHASPPLIVVLLMDKQTRTDMAALVQDLRAAGLRAELYMGDSAMKAQLRYADARNARFVVIEGEDERAQGMVTLKDLALGKQKSAEIENNAEWRASAHAQQTIAKDTLIDVLTDALGTATPSR